MPTVKTRAAGNTALNGQVGAGDIFNGALVGLIAAEFAPADTLALADLTESAFGGYSRSAAVTWGAAAYSQDAAAPLINGDLKSFICNAAPEETVYGMMLINSGGTILLAVEHFDTPLSVVNPTTVTVLPQLCATTTQPVAEPNPITV